MQTNPAVKAYRAQKVFDAIKAHPAFKVVIASPATAEAVTANPAPVAPLELRLAPREWEGMWSAWSVWSDCSVACGIGTERRIRLCMDNRFHKTAVRKIVCSSGADVMERTCITQACLSGKYSCKY